MDFPKAFCERMNTLLGEEAPAFFESLEKDAVRSLRYFDDLVTKEEIFSLLEVGEKDILPFCDSGIYFYKEKIGHTPLHHSGAVYVQEPGAMAPVCALGKEKVSSILDLCAAPGGKSLQAARLLCEGGYLVSNEPSPVRRKVLMQNIERLGETRAMVTGFDASNLPKELELGFDLVIADCPCSGEGMMRKNSAAVENWSVENVLSLAALQKEILESAAKAVKKGGRILYSTCTWSREENEDNVSSFLARHPEFTLLSPAEEVAKIASPGLIPNTLRFYPHVYPGEGQFLAILQKVDGEEKRDKKEKKKKEKQTKTDLKETIVLSFFEENLASLPEGDLIFRGDDAYLCPKTPFHKDLFLSPGVIVGTVQKGRLIPHHRFFRGYYHLFQNKVSLPKEDKRIEMYLRGEEIDLEGKGYAVLLCDKMPLGGVKISLGKGKNLYPKGLRNT